MTYTTLKETIPLCIKLCTKIYLPRSQGTRKRKIFGRTHLGRKKRKQNTVIKIILTLYFPNKKTNKHTKEQNRTLSISIRRHKKARGCFGNILLNTNLVVERL